MSRILQSKKYIALMTFLALAILIAAGLMIVQAAVHKVTARSQNDREIEIEIGKKAQKLPPRTEGEINQYILERKLELQKKAAESPDELAEGLILFKNYYLPAEEVKTLLTSNAIPLEAIKEIFKGWGNHHGSSVFRDGAIDYLRERYGVKDVSDLFDFLMKEHESRNAKLIRLYHESNQYDLGLNADKEKLRQKQGQDFLASIQRYQDKGLFLYGLRIKSKLSTLQAISEHQAIRLVDLRDEGTRVFHPSYLKRKN